MTADKAVLSSRSSGRLADLIRGQILSNEYRAGILLPSERVLAREHGMGSRTVRRALKILEAEALIAAEDRRGYRVLAKAHDPERGCPLAFVVSDPEISDDRQRGFYGTMLAELQRAAAKRQWSLLGVGREGRSAGEIIDHLRAARAGGVVVDTLDPELLRALKAAGMPAVAANAWRDDLELDAVLQDSFTGGLLAAKHLVESGHRRIAWVGLEVVGDMSLHVVERFSGAVGGLARAGVVLPARMRVEVGEGELDVARERVRRLLSAPNRPTAVLALWQGMSGAVASAAKDAGLKIGRDLDVVAWRIEEESGAVGRACPSILWSVRELAEMCIIRLAQRRADPNLPVTKTRIPTRLELP
jgi:DNA-binding LacI/PurR family transcriptional regulator